MIPPKVFGLMNPKNNGIADASKGTSSKWYCVPHRHGNQGCAPKNFAIQYVRKKAEPIHLLILGLAPQEPAVFA
jgi:hypothetical protein